MSKPSTDARLRRSRLLSSQGEAPPPAPVTQRGPSPPPPPSLTIELGPSAWEYVRIATEETTIREVAVFGPRGERKTWASLTVMLRHAERHHQAGGTLPTRWIGVRDFFARHRLTTIETLRDPRWRGIWRLEDDEHTAVARLGGVALVRLHLVGVEDAGAMDKLRLECHGIWFEEPAPAAVLVQSSGVSQMAWELALTSLRLPSYHHPAILSSNYPDEDHWVWQRFVVQAVPGTRYVRIPAGEHASPEDRARWAAALAANPALYRRLVEGGPGVVALGAKVAEGFTEQHISPVPLRPVEGPLVLGWDFGHTPATIVLQRSEGYLWGLGSLVSEGVGTRQHILQAVAPWLARRSPWALERPEEYLCHRVDPSGMTGDQADSDWSPVRAIRELLGGQVVPGPVRWPARRDPMLAVFLQGHPRGGPVLQLDREECRLLIAALSGRWYYPQDHLGRLLREFPKKPNHPWEDLGDAFCYAVCGEAPLRPAVDYRQLPARAEVGFNPYTYDARLVAAETAWAVWE